MLLTAASQSPPKWGDLGGVCFQVMSCFVANCVMVSWVAGFPENRWSSRISSRAPKKFDPLSEWMEEGTPRRATNLSRVARNSVVESEEARSKCTALVTMHTKTTAYALR